MSTFVTVGNRKEPFHRLLSSVSLISSLLPQPVIVQHGHTRFADNNCSYIDFLDGSSFVSHIQTARLIISHGGAGSVMNCLLHSKKPLIVPRLSSFGEIVDDQQLELSRRLFDLNKIYLCEDGDLSALFTSANPEQFLCHAPPLSRTSYDMQARELFSNLLASLIEL